MYSAEKENDVITLGYFFFVSLSVNSSLYLPNSSHGYGFFSFCWLAREMPLIFHLCNINDEIANVADGSRQPNFYLPQIYLCVSYIFKILWARFSMEMHICTLVGILPSLFSNLDNQIFTCCLRDSFFAKISINIINNTIKGSTVGKRAKAKIVECALHHYLFPAELQFCSCKICTHANLKEAKEMTNFHSWLFFLQ